jgi:hypothetical protein
MPLTTFDSILAGYNLVNGHRTTWYAYPDMLTTANATLVAGVAHFCWMPVHSPIQIDRLGVNLITAGAGASQGNDVIRLGIYRNNDAGQPVGLLYEAGTAGIGTGAILGGVEIAFAPLDLPTGGYWLCCVGQTLSTTTVPVITGITSASIPELGNPPPLDGSVMNIGWTAVGITGALPLNPTGLTRVTAVNATFMRYH